MSKRTQQPSSDRSTWRYVGLATQIMAYLILAVWLGIRLDRMLGIFPLLTALLPVVVLIVIFYRLIRETSN